MTDTTAPTGAELLAELRTRGLGVERRELVTATNTFLAAAAYSDAFPGTALPYWMAHEYHGWPWGPDTWAPPTGPVACLTEARRHLDAEIARAAEVHHG